MKSTNKSLSLEVLRRPNLQDAFGPEYIIKVHDAKIGLTGFLVIHNTVLGPGKGGIRMTADLSEEEVYRLAETMTWKNSLADIPFGGAKAGMIWPPSAEATGGTSDSLKKLHVQSFARALAPFIPNKYIAGPDVNSGEKEMLWFVQALGNFEAATGKPGKYCRVVAGKKMCGLPHELGSTGFGVAQSTAVAAKHLGIDLKKARVAIEGFGNVGTFAFKYLAEMGAKIVAVADSRGAIYNEKGLDYNKLMSAKSKKGSVAEAVDGVKISRDHFWDVDAEILVPAAVTDAINDANKRVIKAKLIIEGANIPMSADIENEFAKKGVLVVPDFVANAGGVISSYAEYKGFAPEKMFKLVKEKVTAATEAVVKEVLKKGKNPRQAAFEIAAAKVSKAAKLRKNTFKL